MKTLHTIYSTFAKHNMAYLRLLLVMLLTLTVSAEVWGAEGDIIKSFDCSVSSATTYARYTPTCDDIKWNISWGQTSYIGTNKSSNFGNLKITNNTDLNAAKGVNSSVSTSSQGYVTIIPQSAMSRVGKITISCTALSGSPKVYVVSSTSLSTSYSQIKLKTGNGLSAQGATMNTNGLTFEFDTQNQETYYAVVLYSTAWYRLTNTSIKFIEGASAPTCTPLEMSTVTATPGDSKITLTWSAVNNASNYMVTCPGGTVGSVTGVSTKTCTITGLTNGTSYNWSVMPVGNGTTYCEENTPATGSTTPNVFYTVTWMNNGIAHATTQVAGGSKPTFPDTPESCDDTSNSFYGWATASWSGKINDLGGKTIYTSANAMPAVDGNITYYAVFCEGGGSGNGQWVQCESLDDFIDGEYYMFVSPQYDNYYYYVPAVSDVTAAGNFSKAGESVFGVTDVTSITKEQGGWKLIKSNSNWKIQSSNNANIYLYATATNNGLAANYSSYASSTWSVTKHSSQSTFAFKYNNSRYLCTYNTSPYGFRTYTGTATNGTAYLTVYKLEVASNPINFLTQCTTEVTVTLDLNGGSFDSKPDGWEEDGNNYTKTVNSGDQVTLPEPNKTGHDFEGWYNASTKVTSPYTLTGNTTLTAHWTSQTYNITYKDQGDVAFSGTHEDGYPIQHTYGIATTLKGAIKIGYTFNGWYTNSACTGDPITQLGATDYIGNITLYAKWIVNTHTLTWNVNGGDALTGTYTSGTVEYGATITPPDFPTRNGYDFTYWYDGRNMVEHNNLLQTMPDHDLTYTAQWEAVEYGISYQGLEDASNNANNPGIYTIESETITFLPPGERTGYKFTGWTPASIAKGSTGNKTVTANWTAKSLVNYRTTCLPIYEVTLNPDGGTISDVEWVYNSSIGHYTKKVIEGYDVSLPVATKAGYTNTGWKTDPTTNVVTNPYTVTNNITLIAAYDCALATVGISGTYALTVGDVFQLKATAYDSNGNELECPANATYSWQRYNSIDEEWEAITDDNSDGDNAKLTFNNCQIANCGTYRCHITYGDCGAWSQGYNVHCFHLKGNFEGDWNKEYAFNHTDEEGIATLSMDLLTGQTFEFKIYDGITQYGNGGTIETSVTGWTYGTDNQSNTIFKTGADGIYIFKLNFKQLINSENILVLDVTYPPANQAEGHTIYYDNLVHKWENVYYRIGHNRNNGDGTWGWNQNQKMTLVPGTSHLYKTTTPTFDNFEAWHIANNVSWADKNSIYLVNPDGTEYDITHATEYKKFVVVEDITLTPDADGTFVNGENCTYYPAAKQAGMKKHNAKVIPATGGTITVSYTDHDGIRNDFTSSDRDLAHTCLLTITATPDAGYSLGTLTVNDVPFTSGNVHTLSADAEIEVVWEKKIETALSWSAPTCTATIASPSNEFPTLTVTPEAIRAGVQYSSSIPAVATIDATGRIVLKSAGTTTIRAYYEEDNTYASAEDTYELIVEESTNCRWEEVTIDDIEYGDEVVIAMEKNGSTYALADNNTAASSAPSATEISINANKTINTDITTISTSLIWNIDYDKEGTKNLVIYSTKNVGKWLYSNNANDGVRIGTNTNKEFKIVEGTGDDAGNFFLYHIAQARYLGVYYQGPDWRGYTTINTNNITGQTLKLYKKVCLPEGQYRVTWDANGGQWSDGSTTKEDVYAEGETINKPDKPKRDGYEFTEWAPNPTTMPDENTTFTAQWAELHTITWMVGSSSVLSEDVANGTGVTQTPASNPEGDAIGDCADTFLGWSEKSAGSTPQDADYYDDLCSAADMKSKHTSVTGNKTFYAVFASAEGEDIDYSNVHTSNATISAGSRCTASKVIIDEQKYDAMKAGTSSYSGFIKITVPAGTTNLYFKMAGWNGKGGKTITLSGATANPTTFKTIADAGISGTGTEYTLEGNIADYSYSVTLEGITAQTTLVFSNSAKEQQFVIWGANAASITYSNYVTQCCTDWTPTLTYSKTTLEASTKETATPTITGNTHNAPVSFESSNTKVLTVNSTTGEITAEGAGKATVTARWEKTGDYCEKSITTDEITVNGNFLVTFYANDGSGTTTTQEIRSNTPTALTTNTFQREGYTFQGWATSADGAKVYDDGQEVTLTTSGLDLYAVWQINTYQITIGTIAGNGTITTTPANSANFNAQVTITITPDAHYTFTSVTVTRDDNSQTITVSENKFTMPASDVTITAVFTENPKYNIIYSIPTGGGEEVDDAPTWIYSDGSITLPNLKDGSIDAEYSCEKFIGWTTNSADHEAAGLKPTPFYAPNASFSGATANVTFYPVYSRPGAGVGGTVTLTEEEMYGWEDASYGTQRDLTTCIGTWTTTGYKNGSHAIQLKSDGSPYVKFPDLSGNITQVVLNATNGSDATLTSGTFTLKTEGGTTIASASVNGSGICTIPVTGSYTTAYLYSSVTARITNIAITYGPPAIISTTLDCSSDVDECTITYDSNESFLISGASVYGSCTNSTFRFSEIGEYTICSNIRANQYVLVGWNNQCDGKGSLTYTPGQVITSLPQNNLTLYAQWAPVVSLNDAGSVSEVNATTFGGAVALPDGEKGCDPYEFVGWTTVYPSWNEESILPTIVDNPYTPTEPTTLYAVYTQRATSPDFSVNCDGGVYKIWVNNSAKNHMAGQINGSNNLYTVEYWDANYSEANKTPFTITKIGENTYTIQNAEGHYITRHYSDNKLAIETIWDNLDRYKWTISAGKNGSWRFTNKAATTYALVFYDKYFQLRIATNVTNGSSYYDLELTPVESAVYYSAPSCGPYSIHFYTHGGEFVQGEYAFANAVTEGLTDPTETKFPSAELTGYTFVGWKENSPQDELTDNAPEGDTSAEPYGLKKPSDDLITTTRREYHAVYYYYDELQDIDFSAPFTTGMYAEDSNGDKHFVTGTPHDRYGGLKTTTACGDISEVTITPGTGANAGKFTISINGYSIVPANTVDLIQGNCWWTIEETSEGSGEYKIAEDNEDDRRNIVLRNSEFNYYKETGSAPDFGYGDDVFYPKFGNCREHHWASEPQRKPSIVLGTSGSMTITSSVGQTVKAANKLFVGATNYEVQTKIYLSCNVEGVELLYEDGGALSSDAIGKYLTTTAEGELATTYLILTYTPTATTDGIETVTITAQDEEGTAKATRLAQVRHLPENFVIAAKTGNSWVALTANITSTGTQAAPLIMVDNIALPTKATITPNTTKYQLLGLQTDKPTIADSRFKHNGAAVHLYSTNVSKVISASTSTDNNKTYINADATHEGAANSDNCLFYEWQLQTNDLVHYTLVNSNTTNTSNTKLGYSATYAQWGMYQTGNNVIQEVLLLPIEKDITEMDVEVMEWGTNSMALRFGSEAPATVDITLGATSTKGLSLTNLNSGNISDIYKVEELSLAGNDCEALLITDATDASKGKLIRKPILVNGEKNGSDYTNSPTRDVCMHSDIVILNGGKLTADEAKSVGSHVDFANIYVYPGGKLVLDDKSLGVKRQVYLRGGYSWLNPTTYALPEVYVNDDINFNGSGKMIYDYYIQNQKYYQFALPYDVQLANVTDESGADDFPVWVKHYNGALRAADAYATSWEWYPSENGDANAYFKAGIGYIIAAKPRQVDNVANRPLSIIRFPLGNTAIQGTESDKSIETTAHGIEGYKAGTVTANNVGWNFVGNPFMATWKGDIGHKELAKHPDEDNWDGSYHWVDSDVKFITIMSPEDGSDYEQTIAANADLNPFFPFYLQETAEGGSGEIVFSSDNRIKKAPAMLLTEQPRETYVQIEITTDDATDQTGMFIGNQYSDNIDFDDYEKMFGTSTDKPKVWLVHDNTRLAFEAMTENRATGMTPLGYRAPQDGEYMLVLNDEVSKMGNIEAVYLTDHETGITDYDLTSSDYKFESTVTLYNDTRFTIRIVMRDNTQGSITGIENIVEMSEHTTKFIYQDKIYILHHGVIYDATGKRVITINK